jgi:hypothetical protein
MLVITKKGWFRNKVIHQFPADCTARFQQCGALTVISAERKTQLCLAPGEWSSFYWTRSAPANSIGE